MKPLACHQADSPADAVEEIQQPPSAPTPRNLKVNTQFDPMHQGLPGLYTCSASHEQSWFGFICSSFYVVTVRIPMQPLRWVRWPKCISFTARFAVATFNFCTKPRVAVTIAARPAHLAISKVRRICILPEYHPIQHHTGMHFISIGSVDSTAKVKEPIALYDVPAVCPALDCPHCGTAQVFCFVCALRGCKRNSVV